MKMTLRRATPADAPALATVHVASWHKAYRGIVPDSHLQGFTVERRTERFRESLATHAEETYVAESGGQIFGLLTLGDCRDADADHQTTGEIWGIYLSPEHWRKGIGRFLAEQGESILALRGRSVATLWVLEANEQARRFYEAVGFRTDGATKEVQLGAPLSAVRYCKKLKEAEHPPP
jgi:ribosomal protein S18 acetylase RimI-like enzyme